MAVTAFHIIHPSLPRLVKQRYGTELRSRTLTSIKPEISQALDSLLEEIRASDDAKILCTAVSTSYRPPGDKSIGLYKETPKHPQREKICPLCKQAGRTQFRHFLSEFKYLPDSDRRYIFKVRQIVCILDEDDKADNNIDTIFSDGDSEIPTPEPVAYRIQTRQLPCFDVFHSHHMIRVTVDRGATGNMIRHSAAKCLGSKISSSAQSVHQTDGSSTLQVI